MDRPTDAGSFAEAVYSLLSPYAWDDENQGWALLLYLGAIGQMFQDWDSYAHLGENGEDPWSILLDINRIPDAGVPWLGQFLGVNANTSFTPDRQRQQIRDRKSWSRGTVDALIRAIQVELTGTQAVLIVERSPDAYGFVVQTYATESPPDFSYSEIYTEYLTYEAFYEAWDTYDQYWLSHGAARILEDIARNKPAGLVPSYIILAGSPGTVNSYATIFNKYDSYRDLWNADQAYSDVYAELI